VTNLNHFINFFIFSWFIYSKLTEFPKMFSGM